MKILPLLLLVTILENVEGKLDPGGAMPLLDDAQHAWSRQYYRFATDSSLESRFDPLYFCTSFPNGIEKVTEKTFKRLRRNTPDAEFWMYEPQYHHWNTRFRRDKVRVDGNNVTKDISPDAEGIWHWWSSELGPDKEDRDDLYGSQQLMYQKEMRDAVSRRGFYFRTEVTAIKDKEGPGGSILKGWFHLKVTLERANGAAKIPIENGKPAEDLQKDYPKGFLDDDVNFIIDRLIVTSRGLGVGMGPDNQKSHTVLIRSAGVGQFVHDFPKCMKGKEREDGKFEKSIEEEYVPEQFLWCAGANGREHMPSNNFIYVRTEDDKYGPTSDPNGKLDKTRKEIHLNFRLHHSFCNLFYEVDFIVAGVIAKEGTHINHGNNLHKTWNELADNNEVFFVQRSLSTRLKFVTEEGPGKSAPGTPVTDHQQFKFYESADRVPEVEEVYCDEPLTDKTGTTLGDVLTNANSPYTGAIKSVIALPENINKITRIDLSYHDLHRVTTNENLRERGSTNYADARRNIEIIKHEVQEWCKFSGQIYPDATVKGFSLYENQTFGARCHNPNSLFIYEEKKLWGGRSSYSIEACLFGETITPAACDAAFYQRSAFLVDKDHTQTGYDIPLAKGVTSDDELKNLKIDGKDEPLRLTTLTPLTSNLKEWVEKTYGFKYNYDTTEKMREIDELKTLSTEDLDKIWFNSTFTVPNFEALDEECNKRNDKIREMGGCPLIPAYPMAEQPKVETRAKKKGKESDTKRKEIGLRGMRIDNPATMYIWDTRIIHSIVLTILTIFVVPISIFMARYYKETFMNVRVLYHHVWYLVHLVASLMTLSLLFIGMWRQFRSRWWLGVNMKRVSTIHRLLGWIAIVLSFLMVLFGCFRPFNIIARGLFISFHWLFGMLIYIFFVACMMTSIWIPASPSTYKDNSVYESSIKELFTTEVVFMTLVFWIVFDLGMHIIMSVLAIMNDRILKLSTSRLYLPSMIPVINENFRFDIPGFGARKFLLAVYILVSGVCTAVICAAVCLYSPLDRGFGYMTCTHKENGQKLTEYPLNCALKKI